MMFGRSIKIIGHHDKLFHGTLAVDRSKTSAYAHLKAFFVL
jgi:hypothetical protein